MNDKYTKTDQIISKSSADKSDQGLERIEGLDSTGETWGDYPIDELLISTDHRSVYEVIRRIKKGFFIMNPDFQCDFIWDEKTK